MKKLISFISIFLLTSCGGVKEEDFKSTVPARPAFEDRIVETSEEESEKLPKEVNYAVPFFSQAPDADWSLPWQEACEEASLVLAYNYIQGNNLSKKQFKKEILEMVEWQKENFDYYESTTVKQTSLVLEGYYKTTNYKILEDPSIDDLKRELTDGNLIVAPFAGRMLGNPFFSGEGPYYHMLVIRGYDEENFITNDVGTKRGENFIYPYRQFMNAMHDYQKENIKLASKSVIVFLNVADHA